MVPHSCDLSLPASLKGTDLEVLTCYQSWCTVQPWMHLSVGTMNFKLLHPVSNWNLKPSKIEGLNTSLQRQLWHSLPPLSLLPLDCLSSQPSLTPKPNIGTSRQLTYSFSYTNKCIQLIIYVYELIHVSVISHHPQWDNAWNQGY